jgi:hypothetical protein
MNSCAPEGTSVTLVANPVISYEREKDRITTNGTCPWSFVTQIFYNGHGGDRNTFQVFNLFLKTIKNHVFEFLC